MTVKKLSTTFSRLIREVLTIEELDEVVRRNRQSVLDNKQTCATHDFVDANMVMADAFIEAFGRIEELDDDDDLDLWNGAWNRSIGNGFKEEQS